MNAFKEGFWRWVVALVGCLVQSRFWHDGGQVSAVLGVFPLHAHSKASPALGMGWHSTALPKVAHPAFTSLSQPGWRSRALLRRSRLREVPSSAGAVSPGTGAAVSSGGYLRVERLWRRTDPSCSRLMMKLLPAGSINVPSKSLSLCILDTGL